jgi:hypothetical protein
MPVIAFVSLNGSVAGFAERGAIRNADDFAAEVVERLRGRKRVAA